MAMSLESKLQVITQNEAIIKAIPTLVFTEEDADLALATLRTTWKLAREASLAIISNLSDKEEQNHD